MTSVHSTVRVRGIHFFFNLKVSVKKQKQSVVVVAWMQHGLLPEEQGTNRPCAWWVAPHIMQDAFTGVDVTDSSEAAANDPLSVFNRSPQCLFYLQLSSTCYDTPWPCRRRWALMGPAHFCLRRKQRSTQQWMLHLCLSVYFEAFHQYFSMRATAWKGAVCK